MFRPPERNANLLKNIIVAGQISMVFVIVVALLSYFWNRLSLGFLDKEIQIVIIAAVMFSIIMVASYILNRRW